MHVEFVHQMASIKDAYQAVLDVDGEGGELVCGSGIMLLICKGGSSDWYFYVDLNDPSSDDKARILGIMDKGGTRTDQRINDILRNPHLGICLSGNAEQVAAGLEQLGQTIRDVTKGFLI